MDQDNNQKNTGNSNSYDIPVIDETDNEWEQLSHKLGKDISYMQDENTFFDEVNSSLAKQISLEMEENNTSKKGAVKKKKRFYKGLKIFAIVFSVLMLIGGFFMFTSPGRKIILDMAGKYIYRNLKYNPGTSTPVISSNNNNTPATTEETPKPQQEIVNILLIGVEEIGGASNTDAMIIATIDTKNKTMKLTSLMRDLYVDIDGHDDNKLNSVYSMGGIDLLYNTIEKNFGLTPDGYVMVNFEALEQIVDIFGGVQITLTKDEAHYLNTTNYISDPANRHVVEGTQTVNGNQAVGYCRVRKRSTGTENNDFGRTQRQRAVLNSLFEKAKSKNIIQLGLLMNKILNTVKITTDITQSEFNDYLNEAASLNVKELKQLRLPTDGSFDNKRVPIGSYNVEVLVPKDWDATRAELKDFIYGTTANSSDESSDSTDSSDSTESSTSQ